MSVMSRCDASWKVTLPVLASTDLLLLTWHLQSPQTECGPFKQEVCGQSRSELICGSRTFSRCPLKSTSSSGFYARPLFCNSQWVTPPSLFTYSQPPDDWRIMQPMRWFKWVLKIWRWKSWKFKLLYVFICAQSWSEEGNKELEWVYECCCSSQAGGRLAFSCYRN